MEVTLFVESNTTNDPEIDKLIEAVELLDGESAKNQNKLTFREEEIISFFNNPLSKLYGAGSYKGHHDHEGTYILRGKLTFPDGILPENKPTKRQKKEKSEEVSKIADRWEASVLRCTKFPHWKKICESVEEI